MHFPHPKERLSKTALKKLPTTDERIAEIHQTSSNMTWVHNDLWYSGITYGIISVLLKQEKSADEIVGFCVEYFPTLKIPYWWYQLAERDVKKAIETATSPVREDWMLLSKIVQKIPMDEKSEKDCGHSGGG